MTTPETRRYFLPALWVRFAGAILLGLLYQFWYDGGDTFNYFTHGSRWIYEAFWTDPVSGVALLLEEGGQRVPETFQFSKNIWYYRDPNSYFVVRIAAFFDLFTFHTYSSTAILFSAFGFSGSWAMFSAVAKKYPNEASLLALGICFIPSVLFWGSGILKDTITLGALGWVTWSLVNIIELKNRTVWTWTVVLCATYLIFSIKIYILICLIPAVIIWIYWDRIFSIKSMLFRVLFAPLFLLLFLVAGYLIVSQVSSYSERYALDDIAQRAAITAYDIRYGWGARTGGDGGYDLGVLDGTWQSMVRLMPAAINVSLFRPYPWEVRNPLMLLSAIEALLTLLLTVKFLLRRGSFKYVLQDPFQLFCFLFSLLFAFAVGVSTFNFGTLMRYKVPLLPFYFVFLILLRKQAKISFQVNPEMKRIEGFRKVETN